MNPTTILNQYFGYDNFRPGQDEIIENILQGQDCLAIMPTGAGKSMCFQIPALLMDGITLVISPLISLMKDQVDALRQMGVPAAFINSSLSTSQTYKALENARQGAYKIIYIAPERLDAPSFLSFAQEANISMLAVDEAHCVSHWGQDFRPSYLQIKNFVNTLPTRPILTAFTATATGLVKDDIIQMLGLEAPFVRSTGFNRENLYLEVRRPRGKQAKLAEVESYLDQNRSKSGIVYCATRKAVDEIASHLNSIGVAAARYHAGMDQDERNEAQQNFIHDKSSIMVATNAFGMGIDKSNVAFVIHYNMPKNMESYYQEAGRAGRDGSSADCIILFSPQDIMINRHLIEYGESEHKDRDYKRLREMERYCTTTNCLRQYILDYFEDKGKYNCDNCSNCRTEFEKQDITIEAQKILSCIYRMKGRFGLTMVIEVLRGSQSKRLMGAGLNTIKSYGIMAETSQNEIHQIAQYLIQQGYIKVIGDQYPIVKVGEIGLDALQNTITIEMPVFEKPVQAVKKSTKSSVPMYKVDNKLFEQLKALRLSIAQGESVPAFVIFSDASLNDMCAKLPTDENSFLSVSGVGEVKLKKYGAAFLKLISKFTEGSTEDLETWQAENPQTLEAQFQFSEYPIHLRGFIEQANIMLVKIRGKGTSTAKISDMLEKDGYLEMKEQADGKRSRQPTQKGYELGILSIEEESPDGRVFMRNYFGKEAQEKMLGYVMELARG